MDLLFEKIFSKIYFLMLKFCRFRTKNFFKDFVLEHLSSEGKKLGHLVFYFSRRDTYRKDVIELMDKIHSECSFCDQIFASQYPSWDIPVCVTWEPLVVDIRFCDLVETGWHNWIWQSTLLFKQPEGGYSMPLELPSQPWLNLLWWLNLTCYWFK